MNSIARANFDTASTLMRSVARAALAEAAASSDSPSAAAPNPAGMPSATPAAASATPTAAAAEAALAVLLARIIPGTSGAAGSSGTVASNRAPTAAAAIILTELLTQTHDAAPMELNLNQLLNSAATLKAPPQLPPELLARPQVIEALVLQNTLLPAADTAAAQRELPLLQLPQPTTAPPNTPATTPSDTLYRVEVQWLSRSFKLLSGAPLPTGQRVSLRISARGGVALLPPARAAAASVTATTAPVAEPEAPVAAAAPRAAPLLSSMSETEAAQTIQRAVREWLPRQQPLHTLVQQLQKFTQPAARELLPPPIAKALAQLLRALPEPAQLTGAANLRRVLQNSGSFLEARLARALTNTAAATEAPAKIVAGDMKAQLAALLDLIARLAPAASARTEAPNTENPFVYAAKPPPPAAPNPAQAQPQQAMNQSDTTLAQLSKLLQSGLARIQLNQLDSAGARHVDQGAQTTPVPTWVLELPLRTPHGVDQLQLRIEQHRRRQQQRTRVQWNVEIAFDLHAAGRLAATLAIVDKSVSATLWAERAQTHRRVREEMDRLRTGLESVGVKVAEMQCHHGLPPPRSRPLTRQLVDVHT